MIPEQTLKKSKERGFTGFLNVKNRDKPKI